jgi:signal transduction histidine kinase
MATARARGQSELAEGLGRARVQVGAMRELVEALLLLRLSDEGAEQDAFEWVNLGDVVRDTVATLRERCPVRARDIDIDAPDEVLVRGNPALLAAGVRNLLDNALKFTQQSQRVRVAVSSDATAGRITVDDAGAGVPVPERERVFDSFFRGAEARADRPGFGLGLPILRRVARVHGGDVTLADSPLGGARFELWIPLATDEHGAAPLRNVIAAARRDGAERRRAAVARRRARPLTPCMRGRCAGSRAQSRSLRRRSDRPRAHRRPRTTGRHWQ